ncbi:MAG: MFS transporter [Rickettsiales bacterium]|nr:MFS transporter [Rickettsiales bacterium]
MNKNLKSAWLIWSIPASFFSLVFIIRILPSFVMQDIISFYNINYAQFSLLPAFYYAGYSLMQIPTGILLTKFKNSTIIPCLMIVVAIGTFLISVTDTFFISCLASFIIGAGSAVGIVGSSSIIKAKFDEQSYGFIFGLTLTFGLVAASYAGKIINTGLYYFNWHQLYSVISVIIIAYALLAFLTNREQHQQNDILPDFSNQSARSLLKKVLKNKPLVTITIFSGLMTLPMQGFADVWGIEFLITKFNLTKTEAIFANSFVFLGMGLGSPIVGILAQKYKKLLSGIILCGITMLTCFIILLLPININQKSITILLLLIGVGSSFPTLTFTFIIENIEPNISRVAIGFSNMVLMICGSISHPIIGSTYDIAIRNTDKLSAYIITMSLIPLGLCIGILGLIYYLKYKHSNKFV